MSKLDRVSAVARGFLFAALLSLAADPSSAQPVSEGLDERPENIVVLDDATSESADGTQATVASEDVPPLEPVVSTEQALRLIRTVCLQPLGDLATAERQLAAFGFQRVESSAGALVYESGGASVLLASSARRAVASGPSSTQCTLLFRGLTQQETDLMVLTLLDAERLEIKALRQVEGAVIREFGSAGAGFSAPPLGAVMTLSDPLARQFLNETAGGISVLAHPGRWSR